MSHRKTEPKKYTVEQAFDYSIAPLREDDGENEFQNERCARSIAFLLHYLSKYGNEGVDGITASGLGNALEQCAHNMAHAAARQALRRETGGAKHGKGEKTI